LGDGGIYSSLTDLAKWDEALAQHTLLSESEMQPALTPAHLTNAAQPRWPANSDRPEGTPVSYGFGWFLDRYRNHPRMWHYGDTIASTPTSRVPCRRLTIIVLCNRTDLDPESLTLKVSDLFSPLNPQSHSCGQQRIISRGVLALPNPRMSLQSVGPQLDLGIV